MQYGDLKKDYISQIALMFQYSSWKEKWLLHQELFFPPLLFFFYFIKKEKIIVSVC
jgi:hypothetical protein